MKYRAPKEAHLSTKELLPGVEIVLDRETSKFLGLVPPGRPWKLKPGKMSMQRKKRLLKRITF